MDNNEQFDHLKDDFENVNPEYFFHGNYPLGRDSLNDLLRHCTKIGASDIHIEGYKHILVDIHSKLYPITPYELDEIEAANLLKKLYDENAIVKINGLDSVDTSYSMRIENDEEVRFRVNAIGTTVGGKTTVQITIRTLPSIPLKIRPVKKRTLNEYINGYLNLEEDIWDNISPSQGLIIVTGPTGSGKSTLLASCIRSLVEQPDYNKKIVTYEAPIEFVYNRVKMPSSMISQTEVYTQIDSFASGIESALRRKPDVILIGESRDPETIASSILAAQTGHVVYTTLHTNTVAETISRMVNQFEPSEREAKLQELIDSTKMIISQRLLPSLDGKRCAVKEYLVFDKEVRDKLENCTLKTISTILNKIVKEKQQRLMDDIFFMYQNDIIAEKVFKEQEVTFGKYTESLEDLLNVDENYKYLPTKEYKILNEMENIHVSIVIDKNSKHHGEIVFSNADEISEEEFKKEIKSSLYFFKKDKKITGQEIIKYFKKIISNKH